MGSILANRAVTAAPTTLHRLVVVTRNVREFDQLGPRTLNPFAERNPRGASERPGEGGHAKGER